MNVVSIDSNESCKFGGPRVEKEKPERPLNEKPAGRVEELPDGPRVLTGLALTAWLPTITWCLVINHMLPLYLIGATEILGTTIGFLLYALTPPERISCVPVTSIPVAQSVRRLRKAA